MGLRRTRFTYFVMSLADQQKYMVASETDLTKSSLSLKGISYVYAADRDLEECEEAERRASRELLTDIDQKLSKASQKMKKHQKNAPMGVDHQHQMRVAITKTVVGGGKDEDHTLMEDKLDRAGKVISQSRIQPVSSAPKSPIRSNVIGFGSKSDLTNDDLEQKLDRADRAMAHAVAKGTAKHESKSVKSSVVSEILKSQGNDALTTAEEHWKKANRIAEKAGYGEPSEGAHKHSQRAQILKEVMKK
jgi:hypothetical protein